MLPAERGLLRLRLAAAICDALVQHGHPRKHLGVASCEIQPRLGGRQHQAVNALPFLRRRGPHSRNKNTVRISTGFSVSSCSRLTSRTTISTRKKSQCERAVHCQSEAPGPPARTALHDFAGYPGAAAADPSCGSSDNCPSRSPLRCQYIRPGRFFCNRVACVWNRAASSCDETHAQKTVLPDAGRARPGNARTSSGPYRR